MIKLFVGLITLLLFACGDNRKPNLPKDESDQGTIQQINLLTLSEPPNAFMQALTSGVLMLDSNGCLKIGGNTIIWPFGFKVGNNKNAIYNAEGNIVVKIGDHVQVSGGECADCPKEHIKKLIGTTPDDKCHGNYWIVGEEITVK